MAPKGGKSSASSGTRKKQAKKAAQKAGTDPSTAPVPSGQPAQRGQKKSKQDKKAPKVKQYIPPPPPPKGEPDPVDRLGLGVGSSLVSAETVVTLRKVAKRDAITVEKGLEEWEDWARRVRSSTEESGIEELIETVPVWTHHFARLVGHPSRRVRALAASLHAFFLEEPTIRELLVAPVELEREEYVGSWLVSVFDSDRGIRRVASKAWEAVFSTKEDDPGQIPLAQYTQEMLHHVERLISPTDDHDDDNLPGPTLRKPAPSSPSNAQDAVTRKVVALDEPPSLTRSRLRASALEALAYLLRSHPRPLEQTEPSFEDVVGRQSIWRLMDRRFEEDSSVRRAVWAVLEALVGRPEFQGTPCPRLFPPELMEVTTADLLASHLRVISRLALPSALSETDQGVQSGMIPALVPLLRRHPDAWALADSSTSSVESDREDTASDASDDDDTKSIEPAPNGTDPDDTQRSGAEHHPIIQRLFTFLSLGCSGNPVLLYPAVRILLGTIPPAVLQLEDIADALFAHFWAAADGRALTGAGSKGVTAFIGGWSDCVAFSVGRLPELQAARLVGEQIRRIWERYLDSSKFGSSAREGPFATAGTLLAKFLHDGLPGDMAIAAWNVVGTLVLEELRTDGLSADSSRASKLVDFLQLSHTLSTGAQSAKPLGIWRDVVRTAIDGLSADEATISSFRATLLSASLSAPAAKELFDDALRGSLRTFATSHLPAQFLVSDSPNAPAIVLFTAILAFEDDRLRTSCWTAVVNPNTFSDVSSQSIGLLPSLLEFFQRRPELAGLLPDAGLDGLAIRLAEEALLGASADASKATADLLCSPAPFISDIMASSILDTLASRTDNLARATLYAPCPTKEDLIPPLEILSRLVTGPDAATSLLARSGLQVLAAATFEIAFLLPCRPDASAGASFLAASTGLDVYRNLLSSLPEGRFLACATDRLRGHLLSPSCRSHPIDIARAARSLATALAPEDPAEILFGSFLPPESLRDQHLTAARFFPPSASLAILDDLVWTPDRESADAPNPVIVYERVMLATFDVVMNHRQATRSQMWILQHALFISVVCHDRLAAPSSTKQAPFRSLSQREAEALAAVADSTVAYLVSSGARVLTSDWHANAIAALRKPQQPVPDDFVRVLCKLASAAANDSGVHSARSLKRLLDSLFRYGDVSLTDAERWLALAQSMQGSNPGACAAIILASKDLLQGSPRFERYQNELASDLAGVTPTAANAKGLGILRLLCAVAPSPDSPQIFLPQQRVVLLIQTIQRWIDGDDELEDEIHGKLAELLVHLAPLMQSLSGSHWDLMFDVIESNIEVSASVVPAEPPTDQRRR